MALLSPEEILEHTIGKYVNVTLTTDIVDEDFDYSSLDPGDDDMPIEDYDDPNGDFDYTPTISSVNASINSQASRMMEDMIQRTVRSNYGLSVNASFIENVSAGIVEWVAQQDTSTDAVGAYAWDPRLQRLDAFLLNSETGYAPVLVPFASNTIASAFYDESFVIERAVSNVLRTDDPNTDASMIMTSTSGTSYHELQPSSGSAHGTASDKTLVNDKYNKQMIRITDNYGVASLVNPYTLTKLSGGLNDMYKDGDNFHNRMYDIRSRKRFYDNSVDEGDNFNINNPTTSNIIKWSNNDKWGRTPYSFQDFVFCKYWNIIPNNRLITLRKYHAPTYDNLKFSNMHDNEDSQTTMFSPIATVVTYFGDETGNSIQNLLSFTAGVNWKEIKSEIHSVTGDMGHDPRAVIDNMFMQGGFGGVVGENANIKEILRVSGYWTGKYFSFGKFVGILDPDGYNIGSDQKAYDVYKASLRDPSDQLYSNRILGPVNIVDKTMARDKGITFDQSLSITCDYIARPIGGVNTKAAMIDILSNCLEIGAVDAMWWGGGYRFMINPRMYPFKREDGTNTYMEDLYNGRIFGPNGALAHLVEGVKKFGQTDKNGNITNPQGSFEWSNVTSKLGEFLGQSLGAIGNMLASISSSMFGSSSTLSSWLNTATDALSDADQQRKGTEKLNNLLGNLNSMWRSQVIQQTVMPTIDNMKALLIGEPVGNWHLTIGNPLNPIMVVGNLICDNMKVDFGEELGPDDFPLEMKVTYSLKHAMPRDKSSIESMFNRGSGRTYVLPDFMRASSDYESRVDRYTGPALDATNQYIDGYYVPKYMQSIDIMAKARNAGAELGNYNVQFAKPEPLQNQGNPDTTFITKFTPLNVNMVTSNVVFNGETKSYLKSTGSRSVIRGHGATRKLMN